MVQPIIAAVIFFFSFFRHTTICLALFSADTLDVFGTDKLDFFIRLSYAGIWKFLCEIIVKSLLYAYFLIDFIYSLSLLFDLIQAILPPHLEEYQRLRCRVSFHALQFRQEVQELAIRILAR